MEQMVQPELLVLVPVLLVIGKILKDTKTVKNKLIPGVLGVVSIVLSIAWCFSDGDGNIFSAIVQGILIAGAAVYGNQLVKQSNKED